MEANEIKEAMAFFAIIFNRGDGFWARRWKFFELINNRGDTIIRSHRVSNENGSHSGFLHGKKGRMAPHTAKHHHENVSSLLPFCASRLTG